MSHRSPGSFRANLGQLTLLACLYFAHISFRLVPAPFLGALENDFGLSHMAAGSLFTSLSVGVGCGILASSWLTARLTHRQAILAATVVLGAGFLALSAAGEATVFRVLLFVVGTGSGCYLPSALADIMSLLDRKDLGKGQSVHEMGPATAFIALPLLAVALAHASDWRLMYRLLGGFALMLAAIFARWGRGGDYREPAPRPAGVRSLLKGRLFWALAGLYGLGIMAGFTPFSFLPLYLSETQGLSLEQAGRVLGFSRLLGPFFVCGAGLLADRFGPRRAALWAMLGSGFCLALIGLLDGAALIAAVVAQPLCMAAFFPACMALIGLRLPTENRGLATALLMFVGFVAGSGLSPLPVGWLADHGLFRAAFVLLGSVAVAGIFAVLREPDDASARQHA